MAYEWDREDKTHPLNHSCDTCKARVGAWCLTKNYQENHQVERQHWSRLRKTGREPKSLPKRKRRY